MEYKEAFFKLVMAIFDSAHAGRGDDNFILLFNDLYEILEKIDDQKSLTPLILVLMSQKEFEGTGIKDWGEKFLERVIKEIKKTPEPEKELSRILSVP